MKIKACNHRRFEIYNPKTTPGFVAWVSAFDYGNGRVGLSFKEIIDERNPRHTPPTLEFSEAACTPVSYSSAFFGSEEKSSYRVYMASDDCGVSFVETGRCPLSEGSACNVGFPDGRILGLDVPRTSRSWCSPIRITQSRDGGSTWEPVTEMLEHCSTYLWRAKKLRDGSIVLCASFFGTPWGEGYERPTRNAMLPNETYFSKIETFFMVSEDEGAHWSGPHYILQGAGAHEYDFAELPDGSLLFIAGDVQSTPAVRQIVRQESGRYINGTVFPIEKGAPPDPGANAQGGYVPESLCMLDNGLLVGSRRHKPYSCSNDFGANWHIIDNVPASLYQPNLYPLPDGSVINFGHYGGDQAFGQKEMFIGADVFLVNNTLPKPTELLLARRRAEDGDAYINRFQACLKAAGKPVPNADIVFRARPSWREDGTGNMDAQENAPIQKWARTDANGVACVSIDEYDRVPDIHFCYYIDALYRPEQGAAFDARSATLHVSALTPKRRCRYPHPAYFAEGVLYLSPPFAAQFPGILDQLKPLIGLADNAVPDSALPDDAVAQFLRNGVLLREETGLRWMHSVHSPGFLEGIALQEEGDFYV